MYDLQLKRIRKSRHLTQGELAGLIGSTLRKISSYERGETELPLSVAVDLCAALDCTLDELSGREAHDEH